MNEFDIKGNIKILIFKNNLKFSKRKNHSFSTLFTKITKYTKL